MSAVTSLLMLSEVTLMSGGERDRRICAWDCSQDYVKRAETKVRHGVQRIAHRAQWLWVHSPKCGSVFGTDTVTFYGGSECVKYWVA